MIDNLITVFGCWWCGDCTWVRRFLEQHRILYKWVDIDNDENGEEFVVTTNNGMRSVPTIVFFDGSILVEPTVSELQNKLKTLLPSSEI